MKVSNDLVYSQSVWKRPSSSPALLLRPGPADGNPLRFVLSLLDDRAKPYAGVLQVIVDQHAVEKLFVLCLDQPRRLLQLREVVLLQREKESGVVRWGQLL